MHGFSSNVSSQLLTEYGQWSIQTPCSVIEDCGELVVVLLVVDQWPEHCQLKPEVLGSICSDFTYRISIEHCL